MIRFTKYIIICFVYSISFNTYVNSFENKILLKVNNEIITSLDILNELEYLQIINKDFKNLEKEETIKISRNSVIREKIKEIEIKSVFNEIKIEDKIINNLLLNYFKELGIKNISEFEMFFLNKGIDPNTVKKKITLEVLWNQLIYERYKQNVKIDKKSIINKLKENDKQTEFLLSEILFNVNDNENLKDKLNLIKNSINKISFSQTAIAHSISETANKGGKLGWIKESVLSNKIYGELKKLKIGELTKPIIVPGGFLILKIINIRESRKDFNLNEEVNKIVREKTNIQLNRFSNIYFNKVKKDITINEL